MQEFINLFKTLSDCTSLETHAAFIALIFNSKSVIPIPPSDMGRMSVLRFSFSVSPEKRENNSIYLLDCILFRIFKYCCYI